MKILSLNVWGAPYAKDRAARRTLICERLRQLSPDVILLQEVFQPDNHVDFIAQLGDGWRHHHYFAASVLGSGLLTFSKFPVVDVAFHRFRLGGKPEKLWHGDFFAGKGIGMVRLDTPDGVVDVYNVHTHAQYDYTNDDNEYAVYNETNLYEAARFIDTQSRDNAVVVAGDMNSSPTQLGYRILRTLATLDDAYLMQHGQHNTTYSADNPYTSHEHQVLDYVFVRGGVRVDAIDLVMTEHSLGAADAYSDHYGLLATVELIDSPIAADVPYDVEHVMDDLRQRLTFALSDVESEQMNGFAQAGIALGGLIDVFLATQMLHRFSPALVRLVRRLAIVLSVIFAFVRGFNSISNLQSRKNALQSLLDEIETQIESKRLFGG